MADPSIGMLVKAGLAARRGFRKWRIHVRAKKRARQIARGEIPDDQIFEEEITEVFPKGTMTKSGIVLMGIGAVLTVVLPLLGVGECTADQLADGCIGASQIKDSIVDGIGLLVVGVGGTIGWKGRNRVGKPDAKVQ